MIDDEEGRSKLPEGEERVYLGIEASIQGGMCGSRCPHLKIRDTFNGFCELLDVELENTVDEWFYRAPGCIQAEGAARTARMIPKPGTPCSDSSCEHQASFSVNWRSKEHKRHVFALACNNHLGDVVRAFREDVDGDSFKLDHL